MTNSMFDNYNNNQNCHDKCDRGCLEKIVKKPYENYNELGELIGYYWYYGDSVNLEFTIDGEVTDVIGGVYIPVEEFLQDKMIRVTIYNFREEQIISKDFQGNTTIVFPIDSELSKQLVRGIYHISLQIFDNNELQLTLFEPEHASLLVK